MIERLKFAIADALKWLGWRLVRLGNRFDRK